MITQSHYIEIVEKKKFPYSHSEGVEESELYN